MAIKAENCVSCVKDFSFVSTLVVHLVVGSFANVDDHVVSQQKLYQIWLARRADTLLHIWVILIFQNADSSTCKFEVALYLNSRQGYF